MLVEAPNAILNSSMTEFMICSANQWTSFYKIGTSVMKELRHFCCRVKLFILLVFGVAEKGGYTFSYRLGHEIRHNLPEN